MQNYQAPIQPNGQNIVLTQAMQNFQQQQSQIYQTQQQVNRMMPPNMMQSNVVPIQMSISNSQRSNAQNNGQQQNKDSYQTTDVNFNVRCDSTRVGDRVAIIGSIEPLGEWNQEKAIFLETNADSFPVWSINIAVPRDLIIEYKYVIVHFAKTIPSATRIQTINGQNITQYPTQSQSYVQQVTWENFGNGSNRRLNTFDKKEIILQEEMSNKKVIEEYVEDKSSIHLSRGSLKSNDLGSQNALASGLKSNRQNQKDSGRVHDDQEQINMKNMPMQPQLGQTFPIINQGMQQSQSSQIINSQVNNMNALNTQYQQMMGTLSTPQLQIPLGQQFQQPVIKPNYENQAAPQPAKQQLPTQPLINENQPPMSDQKIQEIQQKKQKQSNMNINIKNLQYPQILEVVEEDKSQASTSRQKQGTAPKKDNLKLNINIVKGNNSKDPCPSPYKIPMEAFQEDKQLNKISIDKTEPIILASFLLPYTVERDKKTGELNIAKCFHNPTMLYGTLENMIQKKQFNFKWIGLVTTLEDVSDLEKQQLSLKFKAMNAYPIFMTSQELGPYLLFYENILRPLFHNFKDLYDMRNDCLKYWKDYVDVNKKVAEKIIDVKNEFNGAIKTIWIHNCHLLMVPLYVKKLYEEANIGLYFHSPFPSSAHFRIHKYRYEILKSLLHCDCIAFHLFMYARNFFKTCNRLLGFELEFLRGGYFGINFHGKNVMIRVSHIGIEESFIQELTLSKKFKTMSKQFQQAMKPIFSQLSSCIKKQSGENTRPLVMSSIDSYHPISGLRNKLLSYKLFLHQYPCYHNKIVLIQFVGSIVQAFDKAENHQGNVDSIKQMRKEVLLIRDEIHQEFGQECLLFEESNPSLEKRLALWSKTDVILCSSLKDGLCIQVLEYVVCRKFANKFKDSIMICSEFAGCNEAMNGVLKYNPFSLDGFVKTMDQAMSLTPDEREDNMETCHQYIKKNSLTKWAEEFLKDLKLAYIPVKTNYYLGISFNQNSKGKNNNRLIQIRPDFRRLNIDECSTALLNANKGVIIVEIEALPHLKFSKHSIPTYEVIEQLRGLLIDNRNTVIIVGSEKKEKLMQWFGNGASGNGNHFWLVAESGYLYKPGNKDWKTLTGLDDMSWMTQVKTVMEAYADNIDGSFVVERQSCIEFNYKNAESEHGTMFIHDLYGLISKILTGTKTEINYGSGYLEVKPKGIKKENLIELLLETISRNSKIIDFIFYLGNDSSAEPVYELLKSKQAEDKFFETECSKFITILEKKPTVADYYIEDLEVVMPLLEKFATKTKLRKKIRSYSDLTKLKQGAGAMGEKKFMSKHKNASIANLDQYFNSKIGLNDKLLQISGPTKGYEAFGGPKSRGKPNRGGPLSASPQIIEEEDFEASQGNLPLANNRPKYPSVGDAQDAQRKASNGLMNLPTMGPTGELAYQNQTKKKNSQNQDAGTGASLEMPNQLHKTSSNNFEETNQLEGGQNSSGMCISVKNLQKRVISSEVKPVEPNSSGLPSASLSISQGMPGNFNQFSGNRVGEAGMLSASVGTPPVMHEGHSFTMPGSINGNGGSGLNFNTNQINQNQMNQIMLTRSFTDMRNPNQVQNQHANQNHQQNGIKHAPLSAIGLVHNNNEEQCFPMSSGHNSNIFAQNLQMSPQKIEMGSMGVVPSDLYSQSNNSLFEKINGTPIGAKNLENTSNLPQMSFVPAVEISSLDQAAQLQEQLSSKASQAISQSKNSAQKFKLNLDQVQKQTSKAPAQLVTKFAIPAKEKVSKKPTSKNAASIKKQLLKDDSDDEDNLKFGDEDSDIKDNSD